MPIVKPLLFVILFLAFLGITNGQKLEYAQGEVILQLAPKTDARVIAKEYDRYNNLPTKFKAEELLSKSLNLWRFSFDFTKIHEIEFIHHLQKAPSIVSAQLNHLVELRSTIPNDPDFSKQWQYINTGQSNGTAGIDLDIDLAWDVTTGGLSYLGDTIVVCVIDDGLQLEHEDFNGNIWINHSEIPNNKVDDDNNGFVDDYKGWNFTKNNDDISGSNGHGTPVAGIIGATGNNNLGVSGVNWKVKIMVLTLDFPTSEAKIISAYDYVLGQRKKYNESKGSQGAFVVGTNASWGVPRASAEDSPIWCGLYDALGHEGVLNVVATANSGNLDVDVDNDMPSSCSSDFILSVTNINSKGEKVPNAGFGLKSVDLGAFGGINSTGTWTVSTPNSYGTFDGTSASTPHVTGTVALLYAAPCSSVAELAVVDPSVAAKLVKSYILGGTVPEASLAGKTVSGGRLNINNSMSLLLSNCTDCLSATSPKAADITDTAAVISWIENSTISKVNIRWKLIDDDAWTVVEGISNNHAIMGLMGCSDYEFQLQTICGDQANEYSSSYLFSTQGCCEAPASLDFPRIEETFAFAEWNKVFGASKYLIRYRPVGDTAWLEKETFGNFIFDDLSVCTQYEVELQSFCDNAFGEKGTFYFSTTGCGVCFEADYCSPKNVNGNEEWIEMIQIDTFSNVSGKNNGYFNFSNSKGNIYLEQGKNIDFTFSPGFSGPSFEEYFKVWIDLDQNGVFNSNEMIWENTVGTKKSISGSLLIPNTAKVGLTRLRIGMLSIDENNSCPFAVSKFGEYEDYCAEIIEFRSTSTKEADLNQPVFEVFPNPSSIQNLKVNTRFPTPIKKMYLELISLNGMLHHSIEINNHPANSILTNNFENINIPSGIYFIRLRSTGRKTLIRKVVVQQ